MVRKKTTTTDNPRFVHLENGHNIRYIIILQC